MNWMKCLILMGVLCGGIISGEAADDSPKKRTRIVLVGDSTVTDQAGWGSGFAACFDERVECLNLAAGGRSSKSYRTEGRWDKVLRTGADYVLLQFGHNDQPGKGPERETEPETTYRANMQRYVEEARAAGMQPVLVTSLTRRQFNKAGKIESTLTPYAVVVADLAAKLKVPLIDLHTLSIAAAEQAGPEKCKEYSPETVDRPDVTHLNAEGSLWMGRLVASRLIQVVPPLAESYRPAGTANSPER